MSDEVEYRDLIQQYKTQTGRTSRETALMERKIWFLAEPTIKKESGALRSKREWLAHALSQKPSEVECRSAILGYGEAAADIWRRIDEESLPLRTAARLMREAKERSAMAGIRLEDALTKFLEDYDNLPAFRTPNGGVTHKRTPGMLSRTPAPPMEQKRDDKEDDPKYFWANLRGMIAGYVQTRLEGIDQGVAESLWRDLDVEIKIVLEHFQHKIDRTRRDGDLRKQTISRGAIIQACHTLNLDPPAMGKTINAEFKKKAKQHFKKLAGKYHPDQSGTNDTRDMYEKVVEAWHLLEDL